MSNGAVLITGVGGLLGWDLALRLSRAGESIVGLDRDVSALADAPFPVAAVDVRDQARLIEACEQFSIDRAVHCGGISGRSVDRDDPFSAIEINVIGTTNVFEAARRRGMRRVVLCSSASVYGRNECDRITEDLPLVPVNAYGASKIACEAIMHAYANDWDVDGVALRIFQVFGPRRRTRCHIKTMVKAAMADQIAFLEYGEGTRCQFVYVDDVVDALVAALLAEHLPQRSYNVAGGTSITLREVAAIAMRVLPGLVVRFGDDPLGREYCLRDIDLSAARRDLGFIPKTSLADGILAYANSVGAGES